MIKEIFSMTMWINVSKVDKIKLKTKRKDTIDPW